MEALNKKINNASSLRPPFQIKHYLQYAHNGKERNFIRY